MMTFLRILGWLVVLGALAVAAIIFAPVRTTPPSEALAADWQPEPGAGEYAMRTSDCMACHTAEGGAPFAGGRPIASPVGTIWTANITPDPDTGIGGWTLDQFRAALVDGLRADGAHLYPAMPYENFRMLTERDIRALYGYFMEEVPAVRNPVPAPDMPFPFNQRWGLRVLNWALLRHDSGFGPTMGDPVLDRGQYLVEGPGHCAACHSPRTFYMGQDGLVAADGPFLSGGHIDGWDTPPLRGPQSAIRDWPVQELAAFLATGRNFRTTANGEMGLVVEHSLQYLTPEDLMAMTRFLRAQDNLAHEVPEGMAELPRGPLALSPDPADERGADTAALLTSAAPDLPLGARLYLDNCAGCHFVTGRGSPGIFPALQGNSLALADEIAPFVSIILQGAEVPGTQARPMPLVMQGYADRLDDEEIAALASFVRSAWGNAAGAVTAADVARIRGEDRADTRCSPRRRCP